MTSSKEGISRKQNYTTSYTPQNMNIPVHSPTATYRVKTLVVMALITKPEAASIDPVIVTMRHPEWLTSAEAMGPTQKVTPLMVEGIRVTIPLPSPNTSISSITKMPKEYIIPNTEKKRHLFY